MILIEYRADDMKAGFTVAELYQALQHISATGADPRCTIKAVVGFRGQLQKLSVSDPVAGDRKVGPKTRAVAREVLKNHPRRAQ